MDNNIVQSHGNYIMDMDMERSETSAETEKQVYIPGVSRELKNGEQLDFDPEAYKIFYSFETRWPCLSFDILKEDNPKLDFPLDCYVVAGSQADKPKNNELVVIGLKNLNPLEEEEDDNDDELSDDESDSETNKNDVVFHSVSLSHYGGINRIKVERLGDSTVCAVWSDIGKVELWNLTTAFNECCETSSKTNNDKHIHEKPMFSHSTRKEGYALSWSKLKQGNFASGDQCRDIHIYRMHEGGTWAVDQRALCGHSGSVEDVHWSPTEEGLLASCSCDSTIKLWDTRCKPTDACVCSVNKAHDTDVNVISWNAKDPYLLSGGDDGELKIWSLKTIQYGQHAARFKYHRAAITSVEWLPQESTTFMASGEDDQVTIWDIATETDSCESVEGVPTQLMFLHLGQKEVKEVHWHPQIAGLALTTSIDGFNVFKTINI